MKKGKSSWSTVLPTSKGGTQSSSSAIGDIEYSKILKERSAKEKRLAIKFAIWTQENGWLRYQSRWYDRGSDGRMRSSSYVFSQFLKENPRFNK